MIILFLISFQMAFSVSASGCNINHLNQLKLHKQSCIILECRRATNPDTRIRSQQCDTSTHALPWSFEDVLIITGNLQETLGRWRYRTLLESKADNGDCVGAISRRDYESVTLNKCKLARSFTMASLGAQDTTGAAVLVKVRWSSVHTEVRT